MGESLQHHAHTTCGWRTHVYTRGGKELPNFSSSSRSTKAAAAACPFKVPQHGGGGKAYTHSTGRIFCKET
ncbi:hypothetical protein E2320_011272, partial [Naja naja]